MTTVNFSDASWAQWAPPSESQGLLRDQLDRIVKESIKLSKLSPEAFAELTTPWILAGDDECPTHCE